MKKCSSCQQEIDDAAMFCPLCGAKQGAAEKKRYPISERAFCRVFRPSFFGGATALGIKADNLLAFMLDFLSLERQVDDDEIFELNHALDRLLNDAANEYALTEEICHEKFTLESVKRETIETETFRHDFISDKTFHNLNAHYKKGQGIDGKHFAYVWLFALASALDGNYSADKLKFFSRLKRLFPVSRDQFAESFLPKGARYNDDKAKSSLFIFVELLNALAPEQQTMKIIYIDSHGDIEYQQGDNDATEVISAANLKTKLPENFNFYGIVEEKIKALCELEYQIQELEHSEGQYAAIADKIAAAARKERELTAMLPGFVYQKF